MIVYAVEPPARGERRLNARSRRSTTIKRRGDRDRPSGSRLPVARFAIASVILAIWAVAYLRAILIDPSYVPPPGLNAPALAAITYLFGSGLIKINRDGRKGDDE